MSTWKETELGNEKCSQCGTIYRVVSQQLPCRDKDSFYCSCGKLMREWSGTTSYEYKKV